MNNEKIKYTFDICKEEALKYTTRSSFKYNSPPFYNSACRNKWLNDICTHMVYIQLPNGHWNIERCTDESLKYSTRCEFSKNSPGAYNSAKRNNWLDNLCTHMKPKGKVKGYWTKERCEEEALKYTNYSDFYKNARGAISASRKGGWFDEITEHFQILGNTHRRFIYAYEFPDNHVYVGLTHSIIERQNNHLIRGSVFDHVEATKLQPKFKQLTDIPVEVNEARKLEGKYLDTYVKNGWIKLNKAKTGAVGNSYIKWNYDNCKKEALKYEIFADFRLGNRPAYNACLKNEWLQDICKHMEKSRKPIGYYTLEICIEIAKDCKSMSDMRNRYGTACRKVYANEWSLLIKEHLKKE